MAVEDLQKLKIDKSALSPRKSRRRPLVIAGAIGFLLLLGGVLYAMGILTPAVTVQATTVSQIFPSQGFTLLNASGYVAAQRKAAVASKATGRLVALLVEEGSLIKKGQVIARLENDDTVAARSQAVANEGVTRAGLDQAKAELRDAELSYGRHKRLLAGGYIAQSLFDSEESRYRRALAGVASAQASLRASGAAVEGAKVALEYTLIRAPFDGVVLTKNADVGDLVTPLGAAANAKAAVVTIADLDSLQVEVDVSETNIGLIQAGQPCEIQLDALPDSRFPGVVHAVVPTVDRSKATVLVKVRFLRKDRRMLPDMSAKVAFLSRPVRQEELTSRLAVHKSALVSRGGKNMVFLIQGDKAYEGAVQTGPPLGDMVEILSGLKAGDRVVLKPSADLKNGTSIKMAEK